MRTYCPRCNAVVDSPHSCPHRDRSSEPWRASYHGAAYSRNRVAAIERTGGRCASCGTPCAERTASGWRMRGGEVHHIIPLAEGGDDSPGNLALLCTPCHHAADAARRAARRHP